MKSSLWDYELAILSQEMMALLLAGSIDRAIVVRVRAGFEFGILLGLHVGFT